MGRGMETARRISKIIMHTTSKHKALSSLEQLPSLGPIALTVKLICNNGERSWEKVTVPASSIRGPGPTVSIDIRVNTLIPQFTTFPISDAIPTRGS